MWSREIQVAAYAMSVLVRVWSAFSIEVWEDRWVVQEAPVRLPFNWGTKFYLLLLLSVSFLLDASGLAHVAVFLR